MEERIEPVVATGDDAPLIIQWARGIGRDVTYHICGFKLLMLGIEKVFWDYYEIGACR